MICLWFIHTNRGVLQCSLALAITMSSPEHETCVRKRLGQRGDRQTELFTDNISGQQ
jgi:hypothetical protein